MHLNSGVYLNQKLWTLENWKQNVQYMLSLDQNFAPVLVDGVTWASKTRNSPLRAFVGSKQQSKQKVNMLELMLGQTENFCPIITRKLYLDRTHRASRSPPFWVSSNGRVLYRIGRDSRGTKRTSWRFMPTTHGIRGRLLRNNGISHHGEVIVDDEELSPTLENFIVLRWLRLIHNELAKLVKQWYG